MSEAAPFDWLSDKTEVLINPRMPDMPREALQCAQETLPVLPAHVWLTTSGSSGIKWVALSKRALLRSAEAVNRHLQSDRKDIWVLALPVFHVGGLGVLARGFVSGASVVRYDDRGENRRWNEKLFFDLLVQTSASLTTLVPTQLHDMVRAGRLSPKALRAVVIGGGALSVELYTDARKLGWPILPSYGLSECCSQVATASLGSLRGQCPDDMPPLELLTHVRARADSDRRIALQSESLLTGYGLSSGDWGAENADVQFVDPKVDGWLITEDRGTVDSNTLIIGGRLGDLVKIGGENVDVARLTPFWNRLSLEITGETVLIAVPDARLGHMICVAFSGPEDAFVAVQNAVNAFNVQVLPFERVQQIRRVSELPRSPLGKILRGPLLTMLTRQND